MRGREGGREGGTEGAHMRGEEQREGRMGGRNRKWLKFPTPLAHVFAQLTHSLRYKPTPITHVSTHYNPCKLVL